MLSAHSSADNGGSGVLIATDITFRGHDTLATRPSVGNTSKVFKLALPAAASALSLVRDAEIERTLNMGVGMVAVVAPDDADAAVRLLDERGVPAWVAGTVTAGDGSVTLTGSHPA